MNRHNSGNDAEAIRQQQILHLIGTLTSGEIVLLGTMYRVGNIAKDSGAGAWLGQMAQETGLVNRELVELLEMPLIEKQARQSAPIRGLKRCVLGVSAIDSLASVKPSPRLCRSQNEPWRNWVDIISSTEQWSHPSISAEPRLGCSAAGATDISGQRAVLFGVSGSKESLRRYYSVRRSRFLREALSLSSPIVR